MAQIGYVSAWKDPDGGGAAKCGGNYAASLAAQAEATRHGCDQVEFPDSAEHRRIEELGGMKLFVLVEGGRRVTSPLSGMILPGVTRGSRIQLARDEGLEVAEATYSLEMLRAAAASGRLLEAFACGAAAVVASIGEVRSPSGAFRVPQGDVAPRLIDRPTDLQRSAAADPHGWVRKVA